MKIAESLFLAAAAAAVLAACSKSGAEDVYQNQIFFDRTSSESVTDIPVSINDTFVGDVVAMVPKKTDVDVKASISVDPGLVDEFNAKYGESSVLLPEEYYEFSTTNADIPAGNVSSATISVMFKDLLNLDVKKHKTYVLPVVITGSNVPVLQARAVKYYYLRGASLVNVIPYMDGRVNEDGTVAEEYGNNIKIEWKDVNLVKGWDSFTYEALTWVEFERDGHRTVPDKIFCMMGSENGIIVRWHGTRSDTDGWGNKKYHYLGIVFSQKNNLPTDANKHEMMLNTAEIPFPERQWVHFAVTYDQRTDSLITYFNGQRIKGQKTHKTWDIEIYPEGQKEPDFYIGYGYNMLRWWPGCIGEVRLWKRALTASELADPTHPYFVDPSTAEGLVGYWKCCEGQGSVVMDYSGNGNNGVANVPIKWQSVALPEDDGDEDEE